MLYALISLAAYYYFRTDFFTWYVIGTHIGIYVLGYRALRNMSYFLCWVIIAIIHFGIYIHFKDSLFFDIADGWTIKGLRNTIFLLLCFQVLRFANLKIQHQELVVPSKGSRTDFYDERKVNFLDFISCVIYMAAAAVLFVLK